MTENNKEQWYTNKDLFEMLAKLKEGFEEQNKELKVSMKELSDELQSTRQIVAKYNGLRQVIDRCETKILDLETRLITESSVELGKAILWKGIKDWGGWIVAVVTFIIFLFSTFGGA